MAQTKNHDAAEIRIREIRGAINELEGAVKQLETRAHDLASQLEGVLSTSTTEKSPSVREPCRCPIGNTLYEYIDAIRDIAGYLRDIENRLEV